MLTGDECTGRGSVREQCEVFTLQHATDLSPSYLFVSVMLLMIESRGRNKQGEEDSVRSPITQLGVNLPHSATLHLRLDTTRVSLTLTV